MWHKMQNKNGERGYPISEIHVRPQSTEDRWSQGTLVNDNLWRALNDDEMIRK